MFKRRLICLTLSFALSAPVLAVTTTAEPITASSVRAPGPTSPDPLTTVLVLGTLWLLGAASSSGGDSNHPASSDDQWRYRRLEQSDDRTPRRDDTSVGCAWGDRTYGTCH